MVSRTGIWLITSMGLGRIRPASGTWGSLPPVVVAAGLVFAGLTPVTGTGGAVAWYAVQGVLFVLGCFACVRFGDEAEAYFGKKDPGQVVADETAGQALAVMCLPVIAWSSVWVSMLALALVFFAFRVMDVLKPWPAGGLQRVRGGWGILLDDLIAGAYAGAVVAGAVWFGLLRG